MSKLDKKLIDSPSKKKWAKEIEDKICSMQNDIAELKRRIQGSEISPNEINILKEELSRVRAELDIKSGKLADTETENKKLENDVSGLKKSLEDKSYDLDKQRADNAKLNTELENLRRELATKDDALKAAQSILNELSVYDPIEEMWQIYNTINETDRLSLRYINGFDRMSFLVTVLSQNGINGMYDWIATKMANGGDSVEKLSQVYEAALEFFCRANSGDFSVIKAEPGMRFDLDRFTKTSSSDPAGTTIAEVKLNGYMYATGKPIKQSIVRV